MLYKKFLLAYDGSEPSTEALVVAKDMIGSDSDATLYIVSVIPLGATAVSIDSTIMPVGSMGIVHPNFQEYEDVIEQSKASTLEGMKEQIGSMLDEMKCEVVIDVFVSSKVSEGIKEFAEDHNVDMVIMGRRGRGGIRAMLGSVSYALLHELDIPVLTVK